MDILSNVTQPRKSKLVSYFSVTDRDLPTPMGSFWWNWLYQDWGQLWKKTFSFSRVSLTRSTSAKIDWTRHSLPDTSPMEASGESNHVILIFITGHLSVGVLSPVWSPWTSRTRSGCTWSGRGATRRSTPTPCSPGESQMWSYLTFNLSVVRIRYRMFSDSDEGGGDRRWSELRTDLLAVEERTPGWLPDIQLAVLMRTNMPVGVRGICEEFSLNQTRRSILSSARPERNLRERPERETRERPKRDLRAKSNLKET